MREVTDPETARVYLEERRWGGSPVCPICGGGQNITARQGRRIGYYRCRDCENEFTVRTGTIFERSHVPLQKWMYALHLLASGEEVSALQLSRRIGVTRKTARLVLERLREALGVTRRTHEEVPQ